MNGAETTAAQPAPAVNGAAAAAVPTETAPATNGAAVEAPAAAVDSLSPVVWMPAPTGGDPSPAVHDDPGRLVDRNYIAARGTRWERYAYHHIASQIKKDVIAERRRLGALYLEATRDDPHGSLVRIGRDSGQGMADLSEVPAVQLGMEEALSICATRDESTCPSKGSLIFLASSKGEFNNASSLAQLAVSPALIRPITEYFGMLPILWGFDINRAASHELLETTSHMYHFDPEDISQIKVFIHLNDVKDKETRPFTAMPAPISERVSQVTGYATGRMTDEQVYAVAEPGQETVFLGPIGTAVFCDTNRCLHFGGRPGANIRDLIVLYYSMPTTTWLPLYPGDGTPRTLARQMTPVEGDPFSEALLGRTLI
jgi:hypothetical protein